MMAGDDIASLLAEREATHGRFADVAWFSQMVKALARECPGWQGLSLSRREAVDAIVNKLARALAGNADTADHWDDIGGYARLGREGRD